MLLAGMTGLEDVKSTVQRGSPEVRVRFDREKLSRFGLDTGTLADMISNQVKGKVPTRFPGADRKIDILVRVDQDDLACVDELDRLIVNPEAEAPLPLSAVADIRVVEGPSEIRRIWGQRAAIVNANLSQFDMGATARRISAGLGPIRDRGNLSIDIGGQGRELESAMGSMRMALLLAVFLVYIVMASQFESLYQPFIIILSVPLAFVGVIFTLHLMDINLSVIVFIGGIMLTGIVVNNAIVLVDYINQLRRRGLERTEAIVTACRIPAAPHPDDHGHHGAGPVAPYRHPGPDRAPRGTSPSPWASGEGVELRGPMAVTVISGLISSTVLDPAHHARGLCPDGPAMKGLASLFRRGEADPAGPLKSGR